MRKSPEVTIIIPIYNDAELLHRSVDSVLSQSHTDWELILVNNGSLDRSAEVCREYAAAHLDKITFLNLTKADVSLACNAALDIARGEWIYFSDADDEIAVDGLAHLYEMAQRTGADICTAALRCPSSETEDVRTNFPFADGEVLAKEAIFERWLRPLLRLQPGTELVRGYLPIALIRRSIIEEYHLRLIPGLTVTEDEAFFFELLPCIDKVAVSTRVIYNYIANPHSACARHFKKRSVSFANMERCWYLRWDCRLRVMRRHNLRAAFPWAEPLVYVNRAYHQLQMLLSDATMSYSQRWQKAGLALREFRQDELNAGLSQVSLDKKQRLFVLAARLGRPGTVFFCLLARLAKTLESYWASSSLL